MSQTELIMEFLGGEKAFRVTHAHGKISGQTRKRAASQGASPPEFATDIQLVDLLRAGLPYTAFESATEHLSVSVEELSRALGLKLRTLARRRHESRLSQTESERTLRLARVFARASEVLGTSTAAREWFRMPNGALGGRPPLGLLDTDVGSGAVLDVLGRIEHGVIG